MVRTLNRGNSRFYLDPRDIRRKTPGVTSIIDMTPKPFLGPWNAKMCAELAIDALPYIQRLAADDRAGAVQYLSGAARRYTATRAKLGGEAHDLFERMIRGEAVKRVSRDLEPYQRHFAEFLAAVNPELVRAEEVCWSDTHDYAGSFDGILNVWYDENGNITPDRSGTPRRFIVDWKTSKAAHAEVGLQLSGYANADFIMGDDGTVEPMPAVDGGRVLHITDKGWDFIPAAIDADIFAYFLHLREVFRWDREVSGTVLGPPEASSGQLVTGTQRRGR